MTSLDRLPLTTAPDLDPSKFNTMDTPAGSMVSAYYSPQLNCWIAWVDTGGYYRMYGIDATDWPDVWAEIIGKEQAG